MRRWFASVLMVMAMVGGPRWSRPRRSAPGPPTTARTASKCPPGTTPAARSPLVVLLHGYTSDGETQANYFGLPALVDKAGFLLATPNGTRDLIGKRFWNATDGCCDFFYSGVDDVAYLDAVIDEIAARYPVDPARVFLVGHSNGAFMSHRYACDRSSRVAAIVTLAGMQWKDQSRLRPSSPVSVLHVHGRNDETIKYEGGTTPNGACTPGRSRPSTTGRRRTAAPACWPPPAASSTSTAGSPATRRWSRPTPAARLESTSSCGPSNRAPTSRPSMRTGPRRSGHS